MDAAIEALLIHSADIWRPEQITDSNLRPATVYDVSTSAVACRVTPLKSSSRLTVGGSLMDADYQAWVGPAVDVREQDLLDVSGVTYRVSMPVEPKYDATGVHHKKVWLQRTEVRGLIYSTNFTAQRNSQYLGAI